MLGRNLNKEFEVNRILADMAARYIALYEVHASKNVAEKFLDEALESNAELLRANDFIHMVPSIRMLLAAGEFDVKSAKHLLKGKSIFRQEVKKALVRNKKAPSERFSLFQECLEEVLKSYSDVSGGQADVPYTKYDMQILVNLTSEMLPHHIKECQEKKGDYDNDLKLRAFGERLSEIVKESDGSTALLAIVNECEQYGSVLDKQVMAEVTGRVFDDVKSFLSQKKISAIIFASQNMAIITPKRDLDKALKILYVLSSSGLPVIEGADMTPRALAEAKSFVASFKKDKSLIIIVGGALTVCGHLMAATDISLILLSLAAGMHVLVANGLLILWMLAATAFVYVLSKSASIDDVALKLYSSYAGLFATEDKPIVVSAEVVPSSAVKPGSAMYPSLYESDSASKSSEFKLGMG